MSSLQKFLGVVALTLLLLTSAAHAQSESAPKMQSADPQPGDSQIVPLTGEQRGHRLLKDYFLSPATYIASAGAASGGQIANDPKEWGGRWPGYGKRVGSTFALFSIQYTVHEGGDALLGYDPRYFRCRCTGARRRVWNALEMSFLAYDAHGHKHLDIPQIVGAYGSGMAVTSWYPAHYKPLVQGIQFGHQQMAFVFPENLFHEFGPELKGFFKHFDPRK